MKQILTEHYPDLGRVEYLISGRNKYIRLRALSEGLRISMPSRRALPAAKMVVERNRAFLAEEVEKLRIQKETNPFHRLSPEELKASAARITVRCRELADKHGLTYGKLHIRSMKTRWGSCSSRGNLNFNLRMTVLPSRLIDYIILHELCHLVHMNHGPAFWKRLDEMTGGNAAELSKELKSCGRMLT